MFGILPERLKRRAVWYCLQNRYFKNKLPSLVTSTDGNLQVRKPTAPKQCASKPTAPDQSIDDISNDSQGKSGLIKELGLSPERKVSIQGIDATASKSQSALFYLNPLQVHNVYQERATKSYLVPHRTINCVKRPSTVFHSGFNLQFSLVGVYDFPRHFVDYPKKISLRVQFISIFLLVFTSLGGETFRTVV